MSPFSLRLPSLLLLPTLTGLLLGASLSQTRAQAVVAPPNSASPLRYRVVSARVQPEFQAGIPLGFDFNKLYTEAELTAQITAATATVRTAWQQAGEDELRVSPGGTVAVLVTTPLRDNVGTPTQNVQNVAITIRPVGVRIHELPLSGGISGVPFAVASTFLPNPLEKFINSRTGFGIDRAYGLSVAAATATRLLGSSRERNAAPSSPHTTLDLDTQGRKSITDPFYTGIIGLELAREQPGKLLDHIGLTGRYASSEQPLGSARYSQDFGEVGLKTRLRPDFPALTSVSFGGKFRWSGNRLLDGGALSTRASESGIQGWSIFDGHPAGRDSGFLRAGVWTDIASPNNLPGSYQRLVGLLGYAREIPVAPNQSLGIKLLLGAGQSWGALPEYARFYGGNTGSNFLDDAPASAAITMTPDGPLLRSFGAGQAASRFTLGQRRGGTSFWHVNLDVAIPIRAWSVPLIPNVAIIQDEPGANTTLKQLLQADIRSGKTLLITYLKRQQHLTQEQAQAQADKTYREIDPITNYIINQANIVAVKPLILLDIAGIDAPGATQNPMRMGFGGGIQLSIVTAHLELGYAHTVRGAPGDPSGNFFARLAFQRFF